MLFLYVKYFYSGVKRVLYCESKHLCAESRNLDAEGPKKAKLNVRYNICILFMTIAMISNPWHEAIGKVGFNWLVMKNIKIIY
uniref:Uncharacterized protein n=1 Tax=Arundo donax TaxID=35708 RepID=A0A0A9CCK2_ARUDO